jgi:hypothetical protein
LLKTEMTVILRGNTQISVQRCACKGKVFGP